MLILSHTTLVSQIELLKSKIKQFEAGIDDIGMRCVISTRHMTYLSMLNLEWFY